MRCFRAQPRSDQVAWQGFAEQGRLIQPTPGIFSGHPSNLRHGRSTRIAAGRKRPEKACRKAVAVRAPGLSEKPAAVPQTDR